MSLQVPGLEKGAAQSWPWEDVRVSPRGTRDAGANGGAGAALSLIRNADLS